MKRFKMRNFSKKEGRFIKEFQKNVMEESIQI